MVTVRLTEAEARRAGLVPKATPTRRRSTAAGPQLARCHTCGELLDGETAATTHNRTTRHARYDIPLGEVPA